MFAVMTAGSNKSGILVMILAMFVLASMDAISKYLVAIYDVPQILWIRAVVFVAFAVAVARPRRLGTALVSARPVLQIVRSLILVVETATFIVAFRYLPLADVHAVAALAPLVATALAIPLLGERVGARRWTAVVLGFVGVLIIIRPGLGVFHWTALLPLLAAFFWGIYQVLVRMVSDGDGAATTTLYTALVAALVWGGVGLYLGQWQAPDAVGWSLLLLLGLMAALAHFLVIRALELAPASVLQPFGYTLMLWAVVMGYLVFDHFPDPLTLLGAAIVVASGLYALYRESERQDARPQP
ncbi:MAG: EamA family transporter [Rhodospirillaceae bacterium]|nr:EamA family transporter [Rhodospirillaceae bacterium]